MVAKCLRKKKGNEPKARADSPATSNTHADLLPEKSKHATRGEIVVAASEKMPIGLSSQMYVKKDNASPTNSGHEVDL